jgi:hypothetical protein
MTPAGLTNSVGGCGPLEEVSALAVPGTTNNVGRVYAE